jgi:hypothetical protein
MDLASPGTGEEHRLAHASFCQKSSGKLDPITIAQPDVEDPDLEPASQRPRRRTGRCGSDLDSFTTEDSRHRPGNIGIVLDQQKAFTWMAQISHERPQPRFWGS